MAHKGSPLLTPISRGKRGGRKPKRTRKQTARQHRSSARKPNPRARRGRTRTSTRAGHGGGSSAGAARSRRNNNPGSTDRKMSR